MICAIYTVFWNASLPTDIYLEARPLLNKFNMHRWLEILPAAYNFLFKNMSVMLEYTLRYDTPDKPQPAYVTMIVAGGHQQSPWCIVCGYGVTLITYRNKISY